MSLKILWFIPTHGDSRYLGTTHGARHADFNYFKQVAVAADTLGYEGVLLPTGRSCEDPWTVASSLIDATRRLKFLVALRPGLVTPVQQARIAATFDRLSGGRLLVNLVTGGDPQELEGDGLFLDHAGRYQLSEEFLTIWREVLARSHDGGTLDFAGEQLQVKGAKVLYPPLQRPYPPLFFGGSSPEAHELAARQLDTYLTWGEPPAAVADKVADIRARAARHGRTLNFGIRLHVIVRETEDAAWDAARELIQHLDCRHSGGGAEEVRADGLGGPTDAWLRCTTAVSTQHERAQGPRGGTQLVGRRGPGARRCRHSAGRQPRAGGRAHPRVRRARLASTSSCRATRTSKRRIALPSWYSRCCRWACANGLHSHR